MTTSTEKRKGTVKRAPEVMKRKRPLLTHQHRDGVWAQILDKQSRSPYLMPAHLGYGPDCRILLLPLLADRGSNLGRGAHRDVVELGSLSQTRKHLVVKQLTSKKISMKAHGYLMC